MLKLKRIAIDTHRESIAYLSRDCGLYRAEEFQALAKIEVTADGIRVPATLNIVDDPSLLEPDELGLSEEAFRLFGKAPGTRVAIDHPRPVESLEAVRGKIQGRILSEDEYKSVIRDIAAQRYSKMEIAAFLVACASFMTAEEVLSLTRAMACVGHRLDWGDKLVVDKHCIGGIPGNRTSMIVVPIVMAHGLTIPKTSSRAITSPAGTADTMEVLARVDIGTDEMRAIVEKIGGCLVWGGRVNLSPADDVMITVERPLGIDTREQMVASILSKKITAGARHLVLDIPVGPTAKVRSRNEAVRLRKLFEYVSGALGLPIDIVLTDGSQPVGYGVGPMLEARDVLAVLRNDPAAPADLRDRALLVAGALIDTDPAIRGGRGIHRARELLDSGAAMRAMEKLIEAQGPSGMTIAPSSLAYEVLAPRDGLVCGIDCLRIARIARLAGAPAFKGAGVDLLKKTGDAVRKGEPLYRVHAGLATDLAFAAELAERDSGYVLNGTETI
ncbi:thymidine phosphorylase family protein [uncultured Ferrovibrio sp.]|jgi:thymidine phosphorylase|uniref:thymidine phosphorylase family protein n=1 Tax=uncultured Ferrovibrio sp. TaxID=1576913 RepID=UPI002637308C|nr:thymidine phosphorylase family protein [uncultured Ferrovibrio sp.]